MKTSLAARHSFRISPSASCTCFPGLPFRTSNSRLMRSSITASSCSLRPSRFRTCLASACVLTPSTTRPKHASHRTCVSSTSTFPFHTLFFLPFHETLSVRHVVSPVVRSPSFLDRRLRPSLRFFVRVTHHLSRPRHERRGRADDTNATRGRRGPRTDTHSRWHLHPRAHGPGATPYLPPALPREQIHPVSLGACLSRADTPRFVRSLSLEQIHPFSLGAWLSRADTPRFPLVQADDGSLVKRNGMRGERSLLSRAFLPRL